MLKFAHRVRPGYGVPPTPITDMD
uniref:Uncharacterized protein n=1 Tax=Romanomermis culicivorax TaxID=13658 RepID=A0A915JUJ3_ROMCU